MDPIRLMVTLLCLAPAAPLRAANELAPVPDTSAQARAEKLVREVFKEDYGNTRAAGMLTLSQKLLKQANETRDEPATRFVLLREARDLAARAGDPTLSLKAVDELAKEYAVDALPMKAAALETAARAVTTEVGNQKLGASCLVIAGDAAAADRYDLSDRLLKLAQTAAQKARVRSLQTSVQAKRKDVDNLKKEYERVQDDAAALAKDPDDAEASLRVGKYYCLSKGDWDRGLPLLAKGADLKLKDLAKKDLTVPDKAPEAVELADGWWDLAAGETGAAKAHLLERAAYWYKLALPETTGLVKAKVEKRLKSAEEQAPRPAGPAPTLYANIKAAVQAGKVTDTKQLGTGDLPFRAVPPSGGLLTGLEITYGQFGTTPTVKTFRPIFLTAKGKVLGGVYGFPLTKPVRIEAKPGYAVGAVTIRNGLGVDGMSVTFMKIKGDRLDPDDSYQSPWYGGKENAPGGETLGGDGAPVVGIFGKVPRAPKSTFNGLGLVLLSREE